jgi:hypothetical protein
MDIAAGRKVQIEITSAPKSAAACKTLTRICAKDPAIRRAQRDRKRKRPSWETWRRGGKMWHHQMKSVSPIKLEAGAKFTVAATVDVLRELESVKRHVSLSPA